MTVAILGEKEPHLGLAIIDMTNYRPSSSAYGSDLMSPTATYVGFELRSDETVWGKPSQRSKVGLDRRRHTLETAEALTDSNADKAESTDAEEPTRT